MPQPMSTPTAAGMRTCPSLFPASSTPSGLRASTSSAQCRGGRWLPPSWEMTSSTRAGAVTVSTPDHMHGTASMWAMARGKHVYCQKPLTRTVWEAGELAKASVKYRVATQMGNQGYSNEGARQCCEIVWNGEIGNVTEVHAWTNRPLKYWPQGPDVVPKEEPVPPTLDWDVWLGGADMRP